MAVKVNLKKYLPIDGKWQFVPVLKVDGRPRPSTVVIRGKNQTGTAGTFYLEWREGGKRRQEPAGVSPREALERWSVKVDELGGSSLPVDAEPAFERPVMSAVELLPVHSAAEPGNATTVDKAISTFLAEVKATKSKATHEAYVRDTDWFKTHLEPRIVCGVTRAHIVGLLGKGREQGLGQASINRRVMTGLRALRNSDAVIVMKKGDWPRIPKSDVEIYQPEELRAFFAACDSRQRLLFQVFLMTGFRMREVATLTWSDVNLHRSEISVSPRPEYDFMPKSYEKRTVPVPKAFTESLKKYRKAGAGPLVFPSAPHPTRPAYGGEAPDAHHLDECKEIAFAAGLNCRHCKTSGGQCVSGPYCKQWYLHKWRHTFCTKMVQSGIDVRTLQQLAGHKDLATTEKYLGVLRLSDLQAKIEMCSFVDDSR